MVRKAALLALVAAASLFVGATWMHPASAVGNHWVHKSGEFVLGQFEHSKTTSCASGQVAVSGGWNIGEQSQVLMEQPVANRIHWTFFNHSSARVAFDWYMVCYQP